MDCELPKLPISMTFYHGFMFRDNYLSYLRGTCADCYLSILVLADCHNSWTIISEFSSIMLLDNFELIIPEIDNSVSPTSYDSFLIKFFCAYSCKGPV